MTYSPTEALTGQWEPEISSADPARQHQPADLEAGQLVVVAYEPIELTQDAYALPYAQWPEQDRQDYATDSTRHQRCGCPSCQQPLPSPDEWERRPLILTGRHHITRTPAHYSVIASCPVWLLPTRYPLCRCCGEIPPCREAVADRIYAAWRQAEQHADQLTPRHCHACARRLSGQQRVVLWRGPNLLRPDLGPDTAVMHERETCTRGRVNYRAYLELLHGRALNREDWIATRWDLLDGFDTQHPGRSSTATSTPRPSST